MPRYRYKAKDMNGRTHGGVTKAEDETALLKKLRARGLYCFDFQGRDMGTDVRPPELRRKLLPPFCRQLSAMLKAGIPLSRALEVSYESAQDAALKEDLLKLREYVHRGHTLSEAMERLSGVFPKLLVYMIQSGEASGKMDRMLNKMAEYYDREEELSGKVRQVMTYPVILLVITALSSAFMLTAVLPQFASMMEEQELPLLTRIMMGLSFSLRRHGMLYVLLLMVIIALFAGILMIPSVRLKADRAVLYIPMIGKLLKTVETSRFASTFAVLYGSGVGTGGNSRRWQSDGKFLYRAVPGAGRGTA